MLHRLAESIPGLLKRLQIRALDALRKALHAVYAYDLSSAVHTQQYQLVNLELFRPKNIQVE
jgi:hypothetical protein